MEQDIAVVVEPAESTPPQVAGQATDRAAEPEVADELLVEEVSIDGMCGVY